jgi:hypothetical protein
MSLADSIGGLFAHTVTAGNLGYKVVLAAGLSYQVLVYWSSRRNSLLQRDEQQVAVLSVLNQNVIIMHSVIKDVINDANIFNLQPANVQPAVTQSMLGSQHLCRLPALHCHLPSLVDAWQLILYLALLWRSRMPYLHNNHSENNTHNANDDCHRAVVFPAITICQTTNICSQKTYRSDPTRQNGKEGPHILGPAKGNRSDFCLQCS